MYERIRIYIDNINFKSRLFDEALKIVVQERIKKEIDEYNDITETEKHKFSPEFEEKMAQLLKRGKKFKGDRRKASLKILKRTAVIVLVLISVTIASLLSVKAIRIEIYNFITTLYKNFIEIRFTNTEDESRIPDLPPEAIEDIYLPDYIPDGYGEEKIEKFYNQIRAVYINKDNEKISYYQKLLNCPISIDGEDYAASDVSINGICGKIYKFDKTDGVLYYTVVWHDDKYFYCLYSFLDEEETIKVAASVKLSK